MTKPKRKFNPTHSLDITSVITLDIELAVEEGEYFVYGAFYDGLNKYHDAVTKSKVRTNSYGHSYFIKRNERYYLADFMKKTPF